MNSIFKAAFILTILFILSCAYYNTLFNAKKSFNEGIKIIQSEPEKETHPQANKFFEQTIEKCWKLIEMHSDKSKYADDAFLYIIKSEYYIQNYAQARAHVNQFLLKFPDSKLVLEANLWYGKLLIQNDEIEKGKENLNKVLNLTKDSKLRAEAYYELGNIAYKNEDFTEAIQYFEKALNEKVDKQYAAFINYYLGQSYFQQKQYNEAIKQFKKVEKFSPSLDIEYKSKFNLGKSYARVGKYEDALGTFRKMMTAPRFKKFKPIIKTEIATTYYLQDRRDEAIALYKEVVREQVSNPGTALAGYNLGKIYETDTQNLDSAVYYYGRVKKLYPKFDSLDIAEEKYHFFSELKDIKDKLKRDQILIYKLETDKYFRDSLYTAQYEDSILMQFGKTPTVETKKQMLSPRLTQTMLDTFEVDTSSILFKMSIAQLDTVRSTLLDSMHVLDSLEVFDRDTIKAMIKDSLNIINYYIFQKAPRKDKEETVELRKLPQIKEDLKNNKSHLAEFFLLNVADYDSALYYYNQFLSEYEDSLLTPKALYSLYFIYTQDKYFDTKKSDSLKQILINKYPETPYGKELKRREGEISQDEDINLLEIRAKSLFIEAEKLYFENHIDSALSLYKIVADLDTSLMWSAKAQYARAWIFENDIQNIDMAIREYRYLKENFAASEFAALATKKVSPVSETISPQDSTLFVATGIDSASVVIADTSMLPRLEKEQETFQVDEELSSIPMISKTKAYREWRQTRTSQEQIK